MVLALVLLLVTPFLCVHIERVDGKLKVTRIYFGVNRDKKDKQKNTNQED
ncbi:hypothetical protein ACFSY7_11340 [Kurthia populi]|uniref:Uncharacterized protein n=1 Tax=Kurthia populi TaxID=1562132 RepID=A0ABW5Y1Z4_9BACL